MKIVKEVKGLELLYDQPLIWIKDRAFTCPPINYLIAIMNERK